MNKVNYTCGYIEKYNRYPKEKDLAHYILFEVTAEPQYTYKEQSDILIKGFVEEIEKIHQELLKGFKRIYEQQRI